MIGLLPLAGGLIVLLVLALTRGIAADTSFLGPLCTAAADKTADWTFDGWIVIPLAASALLYGGGLLALWSRVGVERGPRAGQIAAFSAG